MKIRTGFVSNSSASSFCIYGWDYDLLKQESIDIDELIKKLQEQHPNLHFDDYYHPYYDGILGVGNFENEIDHWYGEDWEYYQADPPNEKEMNKLDQFAKNNDYPFPKMYAETWFNG
jgi:hypothetical protein